MLCLSGFELYSRWVPLIKFTVIVANEPTTDQLYLQKSTWFLLTSVSFGTPVSFKVQLNKNTLKQTKFEDKTVKSTHLSLALVMASMIFQIFQTVRRMREAWKRKKEARSQSHSLSSESAVKYPHVGRRKIQIKGRLIFFFRISTAK